LGCTFHFTRKRWKNIEIGEEIIQTIEEMKKQEMKTRPTLSKIIERLIKYSTRRRYSDSIDIVISLKEKKDFIQPNFYEDLTLIKSDLEKEEIPSLLFDNEKNIFSFEDKKNFNFSPYQQYQRKLINGIECFLVDSKIGKFYLNNKVYYNNGIEYKINSFDYPYTIQSGNYVYLADYETEAIIKYKN
jgi:hypothetical protein